MDPQNLRGVLPPSFRAWYQLLRRFDQVIKANPKDDFKTVVWVERHPSGLSQGYEFTLDEIKARAYDELIEALKRLTDEAAQESGPGGRHAALENLYRLITNRYFQKP